MKLELEFGKPLCYTSCFEINGVRGDYEDFGDKFDRCETTTEDHGCGDMQFTSIPPTQKVLDKYSITEAEYAVVTGQLEIGLSFGECGWCV